MHKLVCELGAQIGPEFNDIWIVGAIVLKFYYTAWDYANVGIGVATTVQSP
jgi:hypothetical protein